MKFDKNYLNHDFISCQNEEYINDYICIRCNVRVYFPPHLSDTCCIEIIDWENDPLNPGDQGNFMEITCDEVIIKNIIE